MWQAALFYAMLLVVPIPSAVIARLKGRWWMGIAGYVGLGSLVVLVSEAFQNSLLHLMWMIGLPLLVVGSILGPTAGSWWDRRFGDTPLIPTRVVAIGSLLDLALALIGALPIGDQSGILIVTGGAMAASLILVVSLFAVLTKESKVSLLLTGLGAGLPVVAFAVTLVMAFGLFQEEEPVSGIAIEFITCLDAAGYVVSGVYEGPDPSTGEHTITGFDVDDGPVPGDLAERCIQAAVGR